MADIVPHMFQGELRAKTRPRRRDLLSPMAWWSLFHAPLILALFGSSLARAMAEVAGRFQVALWAFAAVEAALLASLLFLVTLPLALSRAYRVLAPFVMGLATLALAGDALLHRSTGLHFNRFFLEVALQPGAIRETGIAARELVLLAALALGWLAFEAVAGAAFVKRFASRSSRWAWLLLVPVLTAGERVANGAISYFGGEAVRAAGMVLPLQVPVRMNKVMGTLTGRHGMTDPADLNVAAGTPAGRLAASEIAITRKPDIVIALIESLRSDFLDEQTMPALWTRAQRGLVFDRHYSSASATHFALFSLFYGEPATQRDAVIGAGRTTLLFPLLKANGYQPRLIAASSVDWMELTRSVFADVQDSLETELPGEGYVKDDAMLERARAFVDGAKPDQPVFLFLFFVGTHFRYSYPPEAERFTPCWDGEGSLAADLAGREMIQRRARNSAIEVDRKLEAFLQHFEQKRGARPLTVITGDHGEEMLEHGRVGHATDVTEEQLHVPMVLLDEGLPTGHRDAPTGHIDVLPTILARLGDTHDPALYSSGVPMMDAAPNRFLLTTVGWEPRMALIGQDLKIRFFGQDAGFGSLNITDPKDRPIDDAEARFRREYRDVLRSLERQRP